MLDLLSLESHSVSESHLHFERALQSWLAWRLSPAICLRHKCKLILTSWTLLRCFSSQQVTLQPFMFWVKESGIIIRDQCELDMLNICLMTLQMYCNDLLPCPVQCEDYQPSNDRQRIKKLATHFPANITKLSAPGRSGLSPLFCLRWKWWTSGDEQQGICCIFYILKCVELLSAQILTTK